jgi:uncharacterized damage-inducible protein DinB
MTQMQSFLKELNREALTTRNMLSRVPDGNYSWKPHEKSMTLGRLAAHVAELPGWVGMALTTSELDFKNNEFEPQQITKNSELLTYFEKNLAEAQQRLTEFTDDQLELLWTLRNGDQVYSVEPKGDVIRMSFCQTVHHRAQLGVYLRLLNIPIPGSYGPSADEMEHNS